MLAKAYRWDVATVLVLILLSLALRSPHSEASVLAKVRGEEITEEMLFERLKKSWLPDGRPPEAIEQVPKKVQIKTLNSMVEEKVLVHEAKAMGIHITNAELEKHINRIARPYGSKKEALRIIRLVLGEHTLTWDDLRERARKEPSLLIEKLRDNILLEVTVTDEEVNDYFVKRRQRLGEKKAIILLYVVDTSTLAAKIQKCLEDMGKGGEPSTVNGEHNIVDYTSISVRLRRVEDTPYLFRGETLPENKHGWYNEPYIVDRTDKPLPFFAKTIFSMKEREISEIIKGTDGYYYVFKVWQIMEIEKDNPIAEGRKVWMRDKLLEEKKRKAWTEFRDQAYKRANVQIFYK
jgi:parvulin-like peptidyl-prolyl isomerase